MILALLNAVRPELKLTENFPTWILPTDTLRRVSDQKGFVTDIKYRPSARKRFLHQLSNLSSEENKVFFNAIENNKLPNDLPKSKIASINVLEAITEYIDYTGKIVKSDEDSPLKNLRRESLSKRASLGSNNSILSNEVPVPRNEEPTQGHKTSAVTLAHKHHYNLNANEYQLQWIPAMHLSNARSTGYLRNSDLKIFHLQGAYVEDLEKFRLRQFIPVGIQSLNTDPFPVFKPSWNVQAEVKSDCIEGCYWTGLSGGAGYSLDFYSKSIIFYGLGMLQAGYQDPKWDISPGVKAGFIMTEMEYFNISFDSRNTYRSFLERWEYENKLTLTVSPLLNMDILFALNIDKKEDFQRSYSTTLRVWY